MTETQVEKIEKTEKAKMHRFLPFPRPPKPVLISMLIVASICIIVIAASAAAQFAYRDRIYPHISIGGVHVGGLSKVAALEKVQKAYDAMLDQGLDVTVGSETHNIPLLGNSDDVAFALIDVNVNEEVEVAYSIGRNGDTMSNASMPLLLLTVLRSDNLETATLDEARLKAAVRSAFSEVEETGSPTDFVIVPKGDTYDVTITEAVEGNTLAFTPAFAALREDLRDLQLAPTLIALEPAANDVSVDEAATLIPTVIAALEHAPYVLSHMPQIRTTPITWEITRENLMDWLIPARNTDGDVVLSLDASKMTDLLAAIHAEADVAPQDARFVLENNRVTDFAPSHDGVTVNDAQTITSAEAFLGTENTDIMVVVDRVAPAISTAESNNLGIADMLGQGFSNYAPSAKNRIGNILHGAEKLNGSLIAPDAIFSVGENLSPITIEDGYFPEMVIKGDEILPEVGGGLCQIGTTTFRAAMNSGLKIVERRNHSLVVSHYNDPSNNLPGTDATIYEPQVDLKFQNDTGNYILLTTEVDTSNGDLYFTIWGTSDGRKGSYEPPQVLSRSSAGATVYKETTSLAPGVEKCQNGFSGAVTTFTYSVLHADGTVVEQEFPSTYRSLARQCLVGKAAAAEEAPTDSSTTETEISEPIVVE